MSSPDHNEIPSPDSGETARASVLRILSGLHAGASRTLAEREMILVGSGEDCDIVLADQGVARHHALINLVAGMSSLRALDAPLRVDGVPLHPGDPVELRGLQRIQLGGAAIAFGAGDDPRWATLLPMATGVPGAPRPGKGGLKRLPTIAALAVLSLASLAIFAAVMPPKQHEPAPEVTLESLIRDYRIGDGVVTENVNGDPVLSGTVADAATRERIGKRLQDAGITATLDLRTGEDIAADVSEVLRSQGVTAKTRYLGNGVVEASGRFEDMDALRAAAQSRAMHDVAGVDKVLARNSIEPAAAKVAHAGPAPATAAVRIVSIARGDEPHLVDVDGVEYPVGAEVPGHGKLVSIGTSAHVVAADGMLHKIVPKPVTAEELAAAAEAQVAAEAAARAAAGEAATAGNDEQTVARRSTPGNDKRM